MTARDWRLHGVGVGWESRVADVAVVTDSTAYLPAALTDSLSITVVSIYYDVGGGWPRASEFGGDVGRFYAELDASKSVATTSAPTAEDFVVVYDRLLAQHSAIFSILISSGISRTCSMARQAATQLEGGSGQRVVVIDSTGTGGHMALPQGRRTRTHAQALGQAARRTDAPASRGGRRPVVRPTRRCARGREAADRASRRAVRHRAGVHLRGWTGSRNGCRSGDVAGWRTSRRGVEVTDR